MGGGRMGGRRVHGVHRVTLWICLMGGWVGVHKIKYFNIVTFYGWVSNLLWVGEYMHPPYEPSNHPPHHARHHHSHNHTHTHPMNPPLKCHSIHILWMVHGVGGGWWWGGWRVHREGGHVV